MRGVGPLALLHIAREEERVYEQRIKDTLALLSELSSTLAAKRAEIEALDAMHHAEISRRVALQPRNGRYLKCADGLCASAGQVGAV